MAALYKPTSKQVLENTTRLIEALELIRKGGISAEDMQVIADRALKPLDAPAVQADMIAKLPSVQRIVANVLTEFGPLTSNQIQEETRVNRGSVNEALEVLHRKGVIYIADWPAESKIHRRARAWAMRTSTAQIDKPKPPPMTDAEKKQRFKAKHSIPDSALRKKYVGNPWAQLLI